MKYNRREIRLIVICNQKERDRYGYKEIASDHPYRKRVRWEIQNPSNWWEEESGHFIRYRNVQYTSIAKSQEDHRQKYTQEIGDRLDVYPAFFFIPARCIQPECLVYKEDEGVVKVSDVRSILNSTVMDLSQETDPSDSFLYEKEVYSLLDQLFEKLQRYNRSSISKQQFVRNLTPIMIQLFSLMANTLSWDQDR